MASYDTSALYAFDTEYRNRISGHIVGIDEAGRGPLAGPVVAGAVILDPAHPVDGIFDSKKLSPKKRDLLFDVICSQALAWGIGSASHEEIDTVNILQATFLAMQRALDSITTKWSLALIDGNRRIPTLAPATQQTVVRGDALSASIAAASILAKVTRDRIMERHHCSYPQWEFAIHKGYPTLKHRELIRKYGISILHRKSFCTQFIEEPWRS